MELPNGDHAKVRHEPVRTCIGCRNRDLRSTLWRLAFADAVAQPGVVVVDERKTLPGRGAWIHPAPECLEQAQRRRALARALRTSGSVELSAAWAKLTDQ